MNYPRQKSIFVTLLLTVIILIGLLGSQTALCDRQAYDDQESMRRATEMLDKIDRSERNEARKRYDARHNSTTDDSAIGALCCIAIIIFIAFAVWSTSNKNKEKKAKRKLFEEKLAQAKDLGFSVDKATRTCPHCAETIKINASTCRFCKKDLSEEGKQRAIEEVVDEYLREHSANKKPK